MTDKVERVLYNSPDAARFRKGLSGWVSRDGRYWGDDQHMARWCGCTHVKCECGHVHEKQWVKCPACRAREKKEKFQALPVVDWPDDEPVFSLTYEKYFFDISDLQEFVEELVDEGMEEVTASSMRLINCSPQYFKQLDDHIYEDVMPEDQDELPDAIQAALDAFNAAVAAYDKPACWMPATLGTVGARAVRVPQIDEWVKELQEEE